jgi:hypothetical protein
MRDVWDIPDGDFVLDDVVPLGQPNRWEGKTILNACNWDLGKETSMLCDMCCMSNHMSLRHRRVSDRTPLILRVFMLHRDSTKRLVFMLSCRCKEVTSIQEDNLLLKS